MLAGMLLTKMKNRLSFRRFVALIALGLLITIKLTGVLSAQSVTRAYGSDQIVQRGMIVGLSKSNSAKIEPIDVTRLTSILGVVVSPNDSPITISDDTQHIFVTTSGRYDVLVSDQDGPIAQSDYVTLSAISGIGMKANDEQSNILGRAAGGFDGKTNVLGSTVLTDAKGNQKTVHIARVPVEINIAKNPLAKKTDGAPTILSEAGTAIAGKTVSAIRLYLGAIIFVVGTIIAGAIMYAGVRSSIISIGRNPLSKRSILRSMLGVAFTSLIVFLISVIGVYLLLKL
jgi:hypothetical protein